ncbi:MAG: nitroreductase family protein [Verrucomicrobia bacterium]|nr:nitroreductase family protein [Verrucomicrobiota bacterium]
MPLRTAVADGVARVTIDVGRCDACGRCVQVCRGGPLQWGGDHIEVDPRRMFGCTGCGQCVAACPREAIHVEGRGLAVEDQRPLPAAGQRADFGQLNALLQARRSCRVFRPEPVPTEDVHRILDAARTAPVSLPPSGVGVLILPGGNEVREFRRGLLDVVARRRWLFRPPVVWLLRARLDAAQYRLVRSFVAPLFDAYLGRRPEVAPGEDYFFHRAPLALLFYASSTSHPADATIAATHAMLAAQSLGYGTCFLGFPGFLLGQDRGLRRRYGLPEWARPGLALVIGRAAVPPVRGLRRHFAREDWVFNVPSES